MKIAIPTYDRSDNFKTIKYLKEQNVPDEWITIFLANEDEKIKYMSKVGENKYNWVVGVLGICNQRNFITDYYDEGDIIISMDDDIINITHKDNKNFIEWAKECIDYMNNENLGLLSISPTCNPYFFQLRDKTISFKKGNYVAVGIFHIYRNIKEIKMDIDGVEDADRSILYYKKYGYNARYLDVLVKTIYWGKGGLSSVRDKKYYIESINKLISKHPNYFNVKYKIISQIDKNEKMPYVSISKKKNLN